MARKPHPCILLSAVLPGLLLLAAGCGEQEPAPRSEQVQVGPAVVWAETPDDVRAGIPEVGSCHRLPRHVTGGSDLTVEQVDCAEPHTSVTYLADVIPEDVEDRLPAWVADRCSQALPAAVGLPAPRVTGAFVEWVWLQPDEEHRERGARWFRCEVRSNRPGEQPELPGQGLPLFADGLPDAWRRCVDTTGAEANYVGCDEPHQFRWAGSVPAPEGARPSAEEWEELAATRCREVVGPEAFWFTYPNKTQWRLGDDRLSCYQRV